VDEQHIQSETLAETENYAIWISEDDDELMFHFEVGMTTINFLKEEWDEFLELMAQLPKSDNTKTDAKNKSKKK